VAFCWHSQEDSNKCAILYNMTLSSITPCINIAHSLLKQHQISESILLSFHLAVHYSRTTAFSVCVNFIGFVFVPGYKWVVSADDARRIASISDETRPSLPLDQTESCGLREYADDLFMEFPLSERYYCISRNADSTSMPWSHAVGLCHAPSYSSWFHNALRLVFYLCEAAEWWLRLHVGTRGGIHLTPSIGMLAARFAILIALTDRFDSPHRRCDRVCVMCGCSAWLAFNVRGDHDRSGVVLAYLTTSHQMVEWTPLDAPVLQA
jgi:hypothetical protein